MNVKKYLIILILFGQCKTPNSNKIIQYVLPFEVEAKLLKQLSVDKKPITFFSLGKKNENYIITLVQFNSKEEMSRIDRFNFISKTNRHLLVGNKFYSLLLDTDYQFGTALNKNAIKIDLSKRLDNEAFGIPRSNPIYDNSFSLVFDVHGKILNDMVGK